MGGNDKALSHDVAATPPPASAGQDVVARLHSTPVARESAVTITTTVALYMFDAVTRCRAAAAGIAGRDSHRQAPTRNGWVDIFRTC